MGNVNLPTPVALAGAALCLLAGYLLGVVAGPDTPSQTSAEVASYDPGNGRLCLRGDTISGHAGVGASGELCGTWRRTLGSGSGSGSRLPEPGDDFRFVSVLADRPPGEQDPAREPTVVIYGEVVR
jgi:hypothetical protein